MMVAASLAGRHRVYGFYSTVIATVCIHSTETPLSYYPLLPSAGGGFAVHWFAPWEKMSWH